MTLDRRPVDGLLVLDKPKGWTSHDVVARLRRLTGERRVGHAGTLDPLATGLLVLGIGQGTRVLTYLTASHKAYLATLRLGQATNTFDADGELTSESPAGDITVEAIEAALAQFRGSFEQRPPIYSAIKLAGRPLYRYARAGIDAEVPPRRVQVDTLNLAGFEPPFARLEIESSAGFYVRSLAHDLGQALGCGAHLFELRRIGAGQFTEQDAVTLAKLEASIAANRLAEELWSLDAPMRRWPAVIVGEAHATDIVHGRELKLPEDGAFSPDTPCRAYSAAGELIGVLSLDGAGTAHPQKVFPEGRRGPNIAQD